MSSCVDFRLARGHVAAQIIFVTVLVACSDGAHLADYDAVVEQFVVGPG